MVARPAVLTSDYIGRRWPRLFHMAEAGSWPSIQRHGLLSTSALLDLFEIDGARRAAIESARRPVSVPISHPVYGTAHIRDNKPINATVLARTLVGMTSSEWYRTLNARVFFWFTEDRLDRLRNAPAYRDRNHDILTIDTAALLDVHADRVELAPINTGAVFAGAKVTRGIDTFQPIDRYPWLERCRTASAEPIVELTVPYSLTDVDRFVIDVTRR
jgi:hypothetical protein